jgi:hypothetical protein
VRIGFTLPQFAPLAHQPDQVARFAEAIEEQVGADSLWVGDRRPRSSPARSQLSTS